MLWSIGIGSRLNEEPAERIKCLQRSKEAIQVGLRHIACLCSYTGESRRQIMVVKCRNRSSGKDGFLHLGSGKQAVADFVKRRRKFHFANKVTSELRKAFILKKLT